MNDLLTRVNILTRQIDKIFERLNKKQKLDILQCGKCKTIYANKEKCPLCHSPTSKLNVITIEGNFDVRIWR